MPTTPALLALTHAIASRHQLWPELVCAVIEQESAWNPWSLRYEPDFYDRYVQPLLARGAIAGEGEARARAFSWGLMQVMGQVAREQGFTAPSLAALCDANIGIEVGCRVLAGKLAVASGNVARALQLWNGGANPNYADEVMARAGRYTTP